MAKWKKGVKVTLPSGNEVLMRPFGLEVVLEQGSIPDPLTAFVAQLVEGKTQEAFSTLEGNKKWIELGRCVARYCFLSPRVVDKPQGDDEVAVEDIDQPDLMWLMNQIGVAATDLQSFRPQQAKSVAVVDFPARDGDTPQQTDRLEAVG